MQTPFYTSFYWVYHKLHINFLGIRSINWGNFALTKSQRSKLQLRSSLRRPVYVINSTDKTKLLVILLHRRSATVSFETNPIYSSSLVLLSGSA